MTQLVMIIFDFHVGMSHSTDEPVSEDEELICHLLACFYLCLKVDHRINEMKFTAFIKRCALLQSFRVLEQHLVPLQSTNRPLGWLIDFGDSGQDLYVLLEQRILEASLRWKTNLQTVAGFIYELFCTHRVMFNMDQQADSETANRSMDKLLQESLFRSYICCQGKSVTLRQD